VKTFTIFANCQSTALAKTLLEHEEFSQKYQWIEIPAVHELGNVDIEQVAKVIQEVDLFLYQPVATSDHRLENATSAYMLNLLKDSAQALSFPSIYFDGYFPHLATLGQHKSVLNLVHDYFIAYCYAKGISKANCVELIGSDELYDKRTSKKLLKATLSSLKWRERFSRIDIRVSAYIEENYKNKRLFNQFNHPKRDLFVHLCQKILEKIDVDNSEYSSLTLGKKSYLDGIITPIYRSTYKNLELSFGSDFDNYSVNKSKLELCDVVNRFYQFYQHIDKDELIKVISENKPFVVKRVNKLY
jgi:hypothetical protein